MGSRDDNLKTPTRKPARAMALATVNAAAGKLAAAATYGQAHHVPAEEARIIIEQEPDIAKIERLATTGTVRTAVHWRPYVSHGASRALLRQMAPLDANDTLALAGRLGGPGLPARVLGGDADSFQRIRYGRRLAREPGTDLEVIPGAKHFTPEDHPRAIAAAVNSFL